MNIPWDSLVGGMLLGTSSAMLLLINGKIAGISGVINGLVSPKEGDYWWRLLFAIGLIAGGVLTVLFTGIDAPDTSNTPMMGIVLAGLLVGAGTRLANGCTSGHGICGIGRLSKRSIIATSIFMCVAAITVYVRLHILG
ncbi:YeeE/YedE family protein [Vibrio tubiashii]|uniref:YeeE/YedE family protein n=1 Tax=Vibrio tubiashii TaxID=29498 RepID=UPI00234F0B5C|nr:YeeE/YedE family protein [Vibrio tubiashii]WCP68761.1 YeeE/YedE family protein [Vibrio tubiashii]